jgi:hypothetical protein
MVFSLVKCTAALDDTALDDFLKHGGVDVFLIAHWLKDFLSHELSVY